jgi:hypothetical protein
LKIWKLSQSGEHASIDRVGVGTRGFVVFSPVSPPPPLVICSLNLHHQIESFCEKTSWEESQIIDWCKLPLPPSAHFFSPRPPHPQRLEKKLKDAQVEEANRKKLEKAEKEKQRQKEEYDRLSAAAKEKRDLKNEKKKRQEENSKLMKLVKK